MCAFRRHRAGESTTVASSRSPHRIDDGDMLTQASAKLDTTGSDACGTAGELLITYLCLL